MDRRNRAAVSRKLPPFSKHFHGLTAVVVSLALLASGCSSSEGAVAGSQSSSQGSISEPGQVLAPPNQDPQAPVRLAQMLRSNSQGEREAAVMEALTRAGVAVHDDAPGRALVAEPAQPVSVVTTDLFGVRNLALDVIGSGFNGRTLDEMAPLDPQLPSMSEMLAAYASGVESFGGRLSRELLGPEVTVNPPGNAYPLLVITMFLAEVLPQTGTGTTGSGQPQASGGNDHSQMRGAGAMIHSAVFAHMPASNGQPVAAAAGPCGEFSEAADNLINEVSNATFGEGILASVLSAIGTMAARRVISELRELITNLPMLREIRQGLTILSLVVAVASLLRSWTVVISTNGPYHYAGGGGGPTSGAFTATVDPGPTAEWSPAVNECSSLANVNLPSMKGAPGSPIAWTPGAGFEGHASETRRDEVVKPDDTAQLEFATKNETPAAHQYGEIGAGALEASATVERQDLPETRRLVDAMLTRTLTSSPLGPIVSFLLDGLQEQLGEVINPTASASTTVEFHSPPPPARARFEQAGTGGGSIVIDGYACGGLHSVWKVSITVDGVFRGSTTTTFDLTNADAAEVNYTVPLKGQTNFDLKVKGTVSVVGDNAWKYTGETDVQGEYGAGNSFDSIGPVPITFGPLAECASG